MLLKVIFHRIVDYKSVILGFRMFNMISRKHLKPVLATLKSLDIFSLTATLTQIGTSVEGSPRGSFLGV